MELYDVQLYELLRARMGEKEAEDLARKLGPPLNKIKFQGKTLLATKEDIAMLKEDIDNVKLILLRWMLVLFLTLILAVLGLVSVL